MKKKLIFIVAMICLFLSSTLVGYALFYFNSDTTIIKNIYVDPVKENYDFSRDNHMSSDLFDVYFFPQPRYASAGFAKGDGTAESNKIFTGSEPNVSSITPDKILAMKQKTELAFTTYNEGVGVNARQVQGRFGDRDGYFQVGNTKSYTPVIKTIDGTITSKTINDIPNVKTTMEDYKSQGFGHGVYEMDFSGWTASQKTAINMGYGGVGDFSLIEPNSSLYILDMMRADTRQLCTLQEVILNPKIPSIDGSYCGDNKVFLYPIFTTGKNYQLDAKNQLDCIRLENKTIITVPDPNSTGGIKNEETRLSQQYLSVFNDSSFNGKSYVSKCVTSLDSAILNKLVVMEYQGKHWITREHTWNGSSIKPAITVVKHNNVNLTTQYKPTDITLDTLNLIPEGTITKGGTASKPTYKISKFINNKSRLGTYNVYFYFCNPQFAPAISNGATYMPKGLDGKKISDIYYFNDSNSGFKGWVYVEEKFNYKVFGGNILTFDYNSNSATIANQTNAEGTTFNAANVPFLNTDKIFNYNFQGVSNKFKNSLFTVLPISTNPNANFIEELKKYEVKLDDLSLNGDKSLGIEPTASYATAADYQINSQVLKDNLINNLIKVNQPGYYSISITITPENNAQTSVEKTITVNVKRTQPAIFVAIYGSKEDIKYEKDANGKNTFIDFKSMKAPLYISDNVNVKDKLDAMNKQYDPNFDFKYLTLGDNVSLQTQFGKISNGTSFDKATASQLNCYTLESIFTTPVSNGLSLVDYGYNLYDVVTELPILEVVEINGRRTVRLISTEPLMLRNRVLYIAKDPNIKPKA